ncbi:type II toxin-antitoxin system Phd/YefM family antitoxin [Tistrella mobilis]
MLKVSATEFERNLACYQAVAQMQPVLITGHGHAASVLISAEEYRRLRRRDRQVMGLSDFTQAGIAAVDVSRPPDSSRAYDDELPG